MLHTTIRKSFVRAKTSFSAPRRVLSAILFSLNQIRSLLSLPADICHRRKVFRARRNVFETSKTVKNNVKQSLIFRPLKPSADHENPPPILKLHHFKSTHQGAFHEPKIIQFTHRITEIEHFSSGHTVCVAYSISKF